MNKQDENELTENWHSDTNYLNEKIDDFFKRAQDHAYALSLARGLKEAAPVAVASQWQPIETAPKKGEFLLGVWEGNWNNPRQRFVVYHASTFGSLAGISWAKKGNYRTEEGGAFETAGWMPLPPAPKEQA